MTGTLTEQESLQACNNIHTELDDLINKKYTHIKPLWMGKAVTRKYYFEMPLPHGEHKFFKVKYPANVQPLPSNLTGATFECSFGSNQSILELFLLK